MTLIRANSGGGGGGTDYQYIGAPPKTTTTLTVDHNADKVTLIPNLASTSTNLALITVTINGTSYTGADFTKEWDANVNYSGLGLLILTLSIPISVGTTISLYVNATSGAATIVV